MFENFAGLFREIGRHLELPHLGRAGGGRGTLCTLVGENAPCPDAAHAGRIRCRRQRQPSYKWASRPMANSLLGKGAVTILDSSEANKPLGAPSIRKVANIRRLIDVV